MIRSKPKPEFHEYRDGRVKLSGSLYQRMREKLCALAESKCEICGRYTPVASGEVDHQVIRGMGGARRDDRIFVDGKRQLIWKCRPCHSGRHVPAKVVPEKARLTDEDLDRVLGLRG